MFWVSVDTDNKPECIIIDEIVFIALHIWNYSFFNNILTARIQDSSLSDTLMLGEKKYLEHKNMYLHKCLHKIFQELSL